MVVVGIGHERLQSASILLRLTPGPPAPEQVTGELVLHLRKVCRNLKELDLSRCKNVTSGSVRRLFDSCPSLETLNVSFLEGVVDDAFEVGCLIPNANGKRGLISFFSFCGVESNGFRLNTSHGDNALVV